MFHLAKSLVAVLLVLLSTVATAELTVYHQKRVLPNDRYMVGLLKLAASYTDERVTFSENSEEISRARIAEMVENGDLSILWTGASKAKDERYLPIHIPVYKGMMGHRVFIIRQGDQAKFDRVQSLDDLKNLRMGQGKTWSDTAILNAAGLSVVTSLKSEGLYYMLEGGRFDAFPRGVHEPWQEIVDHSHLPLTVEQGIILKYVMPYYIYVSKTQPKLATMIYSGLNKAIADGSFDQHFFNDPEVKNALQKANLGARRIYTINNPNIGPNTPLEREELWLDLANL
ncbi:hypothetical protein SAMN02745866_01627 [Alteromonadaceae bacterium Bs31]|nr:hypothetical protein SAMN02745866_01627 [Alteromonadaceae bacterium Bs31]